MEERQSVYAQSNRSPEPVHNKGASSQAPLMKIEAIKKNTQSMVSDNTKFKALIEKLDSKSSKTNAVIQESKKKAVQASYDRVELMRDLATYELNAANKLSFNFRMKNLK